MCLERVKGTRVATSAAESCSWMQQGVKNRVNRPPSFALSGPKHSLPKVEISFPINSRSSPFLPLLYDFSELLDIPRSRFKEK